MVPLLYVQFVLWLVQSGFMGARLSSTLDKWAVDKHEDPHELTSLSKRQSGSLISVEADPLQSHPVSAWSR